MIKVAIIRGASLNKFEMQSYELLSNHFYLEAFTPHFHWHDIDDIGFKVTKLHSLEGMVGRLHSSRVFSRIPVCNKVFAKIYFTLGSQNSYMFGLRENLRYFDIVHTAETFTNYSGLAARLKKRYGFKMVVTIWENLPFNHEELKREKRCKEAVIENTDIFITCTNKAKDTLILEGVKEDRIRIIPAGIDLARFKSGAKDLALMRNLGIEERDFVVLCVGRIERCKGVFSILSAAQELLKDKSIKRPIKFLFIGRGHEITAVSELIKRWNIGEHIILTGEVSYNNIDRFYRLADIFLFPSIPVKGWEEQFGMSLVEAMATSLSVISTSSGSIKDVIGDCGILIKPDDSEVLAVEIRKLIFDKPLRRRLSEMARKRAETLFRKEAVAEKLKRVYSELVGMA